MFNRLLLDINVQEFVRNFEEDISKLAFAGSPFNDISVQELMHQIEGRRKIEKKLPHWFQTPNIIFPPKLNLEQTSSEITAKYKSSIIKGATLADITGGFGIDSFFFSEKFSTVHHFELNLELSEIANHNFKILGNKNISCFVEDGLKTVLKSEYDVIYADPSRRDDKKEKVFFLKDCQPNIPEYIAEILEHCDTLLLKTSPMLDISVGLKELHNVSEIHIVAVENEVKELLWLLKKESGNEPLIKTVNFTKSGLELFNFLWNETAEAELSLPEKYLYEPNAAILKSGGFNLVSEKLKLNKLHKNTHLYTSEELLNFPGRIFLIKDVVPYNKSAIKSVLNFKKANIAIRNFPESVDVLRKKWKISDGGDIYLFFATDKADKKIMIICSKI